MLTTKNVVVESLIAFLIVVKAFVPCLGPSHIEVKCAMFQKQYDLSFFNILIPDIS